MSTEEHDRLLAQLRDWCRQDRGRQSLLAAKLNVSRQLVSAWLSGSRMMTLDEWFEIQAVVERSAGAQIQKAELMKPELVDPPTFPAESTRDPNEPRTLGQAKEMIGDLRAELASAKAAPAVSAPTPPPPAVTRPVTPAAPTPPAAAAKAPAPAPGPITRPAAPMSAWEKEVDRAHKAATADLSTKPIAEQSIPELRSALNAEKDPDARFAIYAVLKEREAEIAALKRNPLRARQAQREAEPKLTNDQAPPFDPEKDLPNFKKLEATPAPPPKRLPSSANTPVLIQKILDVTNFEDLSSMLGNPEHSDLQRACIYAEVQSRRAITSDPQ